MATITLHIDSELTADALAIISQHGLTASDAITAFFRKMVHDHELNSKCFCCDLEPNPETMKDIEDARAGRVKYIVTQNTDDLFEKLGI
jgi:antitoxin component of RelBE/YafQ-DinJ toxin-antitoxin module